MNGGAFILLAGLLSTAMLLVQRTEAKRRRMTILLMLLVGFLTYYWANVRELQREFVFAVIAALVFSLLFWLFVGRYNPVGDSDENIQVLGMDD
ncbi:MAG: hypothetical protein CL610_05775 [Anaerolineaceae bacterium]|nr:hypothetical protein [Anaerolineaceae bacterium]